MRAKTRAEYFIGVTWAKGKDHARQKEQHVGSVEGKGTGEALKVDCRDNRSHKRGY